MTALACITFFVALLTLLLTIYEITRKRQDIVEYTDFEDPIFRNVLRGMVKKKYLWTSSLDGLNREEVDSIRYIDITGKSVSSLKGIEIFDNLEYLKCDYSKIEDLSITRCRSLTMISCRHCKELKSLKCEENWLTTLDLTGCDSLEVLVCHSNQLRKLDLSNLKSLKTIWCWDNYLKTLDLRECKAIELIYCWGNPMTKIEMPKSRKAGQSIKTIFCCHNYLDGDAMVEQKKTHMANLSSRARQNIIANPQFPIDLFRWEELTGFSFSPMYGILVNYLNGSSDGDYEKDLVLWLKRRNREIFSCRNKPNWKRGRAKRKKQYDAPSAFFGECKKVSINMLNVPKDVLYCVERKRLVEYCWKPSKLKCLRHGDKFRTLIPRAVLLDGAASERISERARLCGISLQGNTVFVDIDDNGSDEIEGDVSLDVSDSANLKFIFCKSEKVNEVRLHKSTSLIVLCIMNTKIVELNTDGCGLLEWLDCHGNNSLSEIDVRRNPSLRHLDCRGTNVRELDLSRNSKIERVRLTATKERRQLLFKLGGSREDYRFSLNEKTQKNNYVSILKPRLQSKRNLPLIEIESDEGITDDDIVIVNDRLDRSNRRSMLELFVRHRESNSSDSSCSVR